MKLFGEGTKEELRKLNEQINKNFESAIESGEAIVHIDDIFKDTILDGQFGDRGWLVTPYKTDEIVQMDLKENDI